MAANCPAHGVRMVCYNVRTSVQPHYTCQVGGEVWTHDGHELVPCAVPGEHRVKVPV